MDKEESRLYRETVSRLSRQEKRRKKDEKKSDDYNSRAMNTAKMPLGCWIWAISIGAVIVYGISRLLM